MLIISGNIVDRLEDGKTEYVVITHRKDNAKLYRRQEYGESYCPANGPTCRSSKCYRKVTSDDFIFKDKKKGVVVIRLNNYVKVVPLNVFVEDNWSETFEVEPEDDADDSLFDYVSPWTKPPAQPISQPPQQPPQPPPQQTTRPIPWQGPNYALPVNQSRLYAAQQCQLLNQQQYNLQQGQLLNQQQYNLQQTRYGLPNPIRTAVGIIQNNSIAPLVIPAGFGQTNQNSKFVLKFPNGTFRTLPGKRILPGSRITFQLTVGENSGTSQIIGRTGMNMNTIYVSSSTIPVGLGCYFTIPPNEKIFVYGQ